MSYIETSLIKSADSPSIDAFGRWRISSPQTIFDSKLLVTSSIDVYWAERTWTQGTSSYNSYGSLIDMVVTANSGSRSLNQTKRRFVYEPGKSLQISMTGLMGTGVDGIEKYIIYGDDYYALGFYQSGSSFGIIKRNTTSAGTTTTFVSQSDWNIDKFDGFGKSGKKYSQTNSQIHFLDMEWLGVGRVRYGVFQGGLPYYVHEFDHINELTSTYVGNPNLPIRYEIVNKIGSSTTSSMKHICCSVVSEGGSENLGIQSSIDNGNTPITVNAGTHVGLLYLRQITSSMADGYKANTPAVAPSDLSLFPDGTQNIRWTLQLNPVVANAATLAYNRVGISSIEYAVGSTTTTITTPGRVMASGYIPGGTIQAGPNDISSKLDPFFSLGIDLYDNRDTLVVTCEEIEGGAIPVYAQLSIKETI